MRKVDLQLWSVIFSTCLLLLSATAQAQATRTWVSGVGDDANPCSRTAPCKTLAGSISKTAAGGIINVLDPAAVGVVTITKAITIQADEQFGGILSAGSNGVVINAGPSDTVVLRGLSINGGASTGLNGIRILAAGAVRIENCDLHGFGESGIEVSTSSALSLVIQDSSIGTTFAGAGSSPNDAGIALIPDVAGSVRAVLNRVRIHNTHQFGINVVGNVRLTLRDSLISGVAGSALRVDGGSALVDNSSLLDSSVNGVLVNGSGSNARLHRSVISGNAQGLLATLRGQITSAGNNVIAGNTVNGAPTGTEFLQ